MFRRETSNIVRSSMNDEDEELPHRETELIAEINRLRALLRQAGIDAQRRSWARC
jgi:hypothetical protein